MANILELKHVNKIYGEHTKNPNQVIFDLNLDIEENSFNSIIGQSGSGKSTLLNIIGSLDKPSSGDVILNGKSLADYSKKDLADVRNQYIGFIFQFHYLLPEFTALENVLMPYKISKKPLNQEIVNRAKELLDLVELTPYYHTPASNLSGGQQQRIAIARSLINNPKIVLADEPTGNLDSDSTEIVYQLLREISSTYKTTFIIITHDRHIAEKTDRIIEIKDGRIVLDLKK